MAGEGLHRGGGTDGRRRFCALNPGVKGPLSIPSSAASLTLVLRTSPSGSRIESAVQSAILLARVGLTPGGGRISRGTLSFMLDL